MRHIFTLIKFSFAAFAAVTVTAYTQNIAAQGLQVNEQEVRQWNDFAKNLYALHERQIKGRKVKQQERVGGYHEMPDFYREVSFFDSASERMLSRVQWEKAQPDTLHQIEVFVYDGGGRLVRDYIARYLPVHRNAPRQTLINLHHYGKGTHGFRQFDASGNRILEQCRGDDKLLIELNEDEIEQLEANPARADATYKKCFGDLPKTASAYLIPR